MPSILFVAGWRFFFYSNEGREPAHIHAEKAGKECKYWLDSNAFDVREAFAYGLSSADRRDVRRIIFQHFDYLVTAWRRHFKGT